jgi:hypothetical protein
VLVSVDGCTTIADLCKRRAFPVDCFYQGFGSGEAQSSFSRTLTFTADMLQPLIVSRGYDTGFATLGLLERKADL